MIGRAAGVRGTTTTTMGIGRAADAI